MAGRSWFYASEGQQHGPYPEIQLRELIGRGNISADTLVWTEGMANWQRAGDVPGLVSGASGPPPMPRPGAPLARAGGHGDGQLSADLPLLEFFGRALVFGIGFLLVIPAPWVAVWFYRWVVSRIHVPGRPNFGFTGEVGDIWYVFVGLALLSYVGANDLYYLEYVAFAVQAYLSWMVVRWIAENLSSNGQQLPIAFNGSALGYVGWNLLLILSAITIIGWAWVITAWMRWNCANIEGTRREVVFNGSGLEVLWRTIVFAIGCAFLIPIPWVMRWYANWYISQFALVERA